MPTNCALVNKVTGLVENIIMASEGDPVDADYVLIPSSDPRVTIGTPWDGADFVLPPLPDVSTSPAAAPVIGDLPTV
jgi:hypothetical protein